MAIFTGLTANTVATNVTIPVTATSSALPPTATSTFNVTAAQATQLVIPSGGQPTTATAGTGFGITILAENSLGVVDTTYNGPVTIGLVNNTSGAVLGGVKAIAINGAGSGYNPANPPAVTITGGGGTGAAATAIVDDPGLHRPAS